MNNKIKPRLPGGFRDYLPDDYSRRQRVVERAVEVYRSFGFKPLETSSVEYFETLAGGDETSKQIYRLFNRNPDFSGESLALRFDLTVSLARMLAMNRTAFTFPFKRYQIGEVWRGERQQKGRFKQFLQFDADIVGTANPSADAEIVVIIDRLMRSLGVENFVIRLNNRKILNGYLLSLGLGEKDTIAFQRVLDKLDRIGWEGIEAELAETKSSHQEQERILDREELMVNAVYKIRECITEQSSNEGRIKLIREIAKGSQEAEEGIKQIETILELAFVAGVDNSRISFDLSLARGLDYYTGPVFETVLTDLPDFGSVMGGGRYDNLMERFGGELIPATGISLGVDRLMVGLEELGLLEGARTASRVLVAGLGKEMEVHCFALAAKLRDAGIECEVFLGENRGFKKQLTYANRGGIRYCVIIGPDELEAKRVQVKDMRTGEQREVSKEDLVGVLKGGCR